MRRAVSAAVAVCALVAAFLVSGAVASHGGPGVKTTRPYFMVGTAPGVVVDKILTVGDIVPAGDPGVDDDYQMSGIPDGLGAYNQKKSRWDWLHGGGSREFVAMMNHELGRSFPNNPPLVDTRISRLVIDRETRSVHSAEYAFTGLEGYERFCSATLRIVGGKPFYFTGEEAVPIAGQPPGPAHDGSSIVMDAETGMWRDTEHFGHLQHENVLPLRLKQWVFATTEDDFRPGQPAYFYAYFAPTFKGGITGRQGALHVFVPDAGEEKSNAEVVSKDQVVHGHWVRLTQHPDNENDVTLKAAATREGAFRFDRMEDLASLRGKESRVFIADTGKAPVTVPPSPTPRGRVYQFDFNWNDPTRGSTMRMILNGDAPHNDDIVNPDNMDTSERVLMIQEDRESAFRAQHNRVMEYRFADKSLRSVARVNTPPGTPPTYPNAEPCAGCLPGTWESSGIIDARDVLGKDWWLLDVQGHNSQVPQPGPSLKPNSSMGENGQLLALYVPGSQGGGDHDDDDDDDD